MTNILLIHGDDHLESREYLNQQLDQLKADSLIPQHLIGDKITAPNLESEIKTSSLFTDMVVVIQNLLSRKISKQKNNCLKVLADYSGTKPIILWEKKEITKTTIKKLQSHKLTTKTFKLPRLIFKFLTALTPSNKETSLKLFHDTLSEAPDIVIFSLLVRQISNLIIALSSPKDISGAPWQKSQIMKQAQAWDLPTLLAFHSDLLDIDHSVKTGTSHLDLTTHLDLAIAKL